MFFVSPEKFYKKTSDAIIEFSIEYLNDSNSISIAAKLYARLFLPSLQKMDVNENSIGDHVIKESKKLIKPKRLKYSYFLAELLKFMVNCIMIHQSMK